MAQPRALVLRAAGTNCDAETAFAFERCGARPTVTPAQPFLRDPRMLRDYQILAVPGGFSYGDDILAGKVFGLELVVHAGAEILDLVARGGLVIGICNGFQVLVQMGLLPGLKEPIGLPEVTLTDNARLGYLDRWVRLRVDTDQCAFLKQGEELFLPMAHAEGNLQVAGAETLEEMKRSRRIALRYARTDGSKRPVEWPDNPNGSIDDIAGLCDRTGRILGLMPHPERHLFPYQHPFWTRAGLQEVPDGLKLFQNAVAAIR